MEDLGLELLMNNKKKLPSDAASISSHSSIQLESRNNGGNTAESIDVRQHLVPPESNVEDDDDEDDYEYEDDESPNNVDSSEDEIPFSFKRNGTQQQQQQQQGPPRMSDEDIINEKQELLYQFERLERKGVRLPRRFTLASNLEEMRIEYDRIKRDREMDTSVKFQKRMMMTAVSGIEFAADKFPVLGANLSGWSNSVNDELDEYDDIFVELHDKYKGKAKIAPELRLLGGLAGSAFMYHLTNKFSSQLPGLDSVLKNNPDLAAKLAEATRSQMNNQQQGANSFFSGLGGMFGNMFGGAPPPPMHPDMAPRQQQNQHDNQQQNQKPGVRMKGPQNVDDILNELNNMSMDNVNADRVEMMSTIDSDADDMPDDMSSINGIFMNKGGKSINLDI